MQRSLTSPSPGPGPLPPVVWFPETKLIYRDNGYDLIVKLPAPACPTPERSIGMIALSGLDLIKPTEGNYEGNITLRLAYWTEYFVYLSEACPGARTVKAMQLSPEVGRKYGCLLGLLHECWPVCCEWLDLHSTGGSSSSLCRLPVVAAMYPVSFVSVQTTASTADILIRYDNSLPIKPATYAVEIHLPGSRKSPLVLVPYAGPVTVCPFVISSSVILRDIQLRAVSIEPSRKDGSLSVGPTRMSAQPSLHSGSSPS